jgi:hypothetical protein
LWDLDLDLGSSSPYAAAIPRTSATTGRPTVETPSSAVPQPTVAASPSGGRIAVPQALGDVNRNCDVRGSVESPEQDATLAAASDPLVTIKGWAGDLSARIGTGISGVRISVDASPDHGGQTAEATYGIERPDVREITGMEQARMSGFSFEWDISHVAPGPHTLYVQAHSACGGITKTRDVVVDGDH